MLDRHAGLVSTMAKSDILIERRIMLRGHVGKKCLSTEHMSPLMESREPRLLFAGDSLSNSIQIDMNTGSGDDTM